MSQIQSQFDSNNLSSSMKSKDLHYTNVYKIDLSIKKPKTVESQLDYIKLLKTENFVVTNNQNSSESSLSHLNYEIYHSRISKTIDITKVTQKCNVPDRSRKSLEILSTTPTRRRKQSTPKRKICPLNSKYY